MSFRDDFRQWPWQAKITFPLWLPIFLVFAVVFYFAEWIIHGRMPR